MDENVVPKLTIVFKVALDDGIITVAEIDQDWNWSGNIAYIEMLKMSILRTSMAEFPTRIEDLPRIFKGKILWAEVKKCDK